MSDFKEKRDDLERFLREQIIGPGAFNRRFFLLKKWQDNEFNGRSLKDCLAYHNGSEVIAEVPAYQYSSGILFPITEQLSIQKKESTDSKVTNEAPDAGDGQEPVLKMDDEEMTDEQSESISSKNQNYPNTCGLAFAIDKTVKPESDLKVEISYRTYSKLKQETSVMYQLGYWVSNREQEIKDIFDKYYNSVFEPKWIDDNLFIILLNGIDINQHLYTLDYVNTETYLQDLIIPFINDKFPENKYFKPTIKTYEGTEFNFTSFHEEKLIEEIKKEILSDSTQYGNYKETIELLELFNKVKEIVLELKTIYRKSSMKNHPTPIWESQRSLKEVSLPPFLDQNKIQRGEIKIEDVEKLVVKYQYLRYINSFSKKECIYIKLILVNKNTIELKEDEPPQLNKKDEANKKAFFGVEINVEELNSSLIQPYNPPNLLEIDQEDNFNKLVYRQYKDYAEGYNTSVNWNRKNDRLVLSTEFLPYQETPKVDFKPSQNINGAIRSRINDSTLSFRYLSTIGDSSDTEIVNSLHLFIDEYYKWIEEKRKELNNDATLENGKELLVRQLAACEADYKRLKRNIALLATNTKALISFRLMNTAMFMQLHHSIMVKNAKKGKTGPFIPLSNEASFYTQITLNNEYKWRSFQLAFVLLNIDAFVQPKQGDMTVPDVFGTGWPERNDLADLVWFPTGGGKTEAYLGIIAFAIAYRRFNKGVKGNGTTVLMRYTLRLLTLQQFQRATLLICAMESIRKNSFAIPNQLTLGKERITIGLFVGSKSLPNTWDEMEKTLDKIVENIKEGKNIRTNLPYTECPWCGGDLFVNEQLKNVDPYGGTYKKDTNMHIVCNSDGCSFHSKRPTEDKSLPLRLFDEDIYKSPPTLLFGTVDKFAALANKVSTRNADKDADSRRLFGRGGMNTDPPELIIQDELHLLLGPLGSAVGLFEKAIDELCSTIVDGKLIKAKVITSTATTRNTEKQIFALFNRRSEIFPKQGINCDDSFFAYYEREIINGAENYISNRKYIGVLPIGKTQVWMQLRVASIALTHRLKFLKDKFSKDEIFGNALAYQQYKEVFNYYHTILSYFNSLKEVGKTQSQLSHYLPGDVNLITKNTLSWDFLDKLVRNGSEIKESELTGRLNGEQVKTNLAEVEKNWDITSKDNPPEFVIATNMISVGIDVSRFNTMIITSMPRNTAEYIQASSRVARDKEGLVLTVHHPFRSRDISHYQRFKEFHEKFYSYVEPISVTPFAHKALERFFAMFLSVMVRHNESLKLNDNGDAGSLTKEKVDTIIQLVSNSMDVVGNNSKKLDTYLREKKQGLNSSIAGIIDDEELADIKNKTNELMIQRWLDRVIVNGSFLPLNFRDEQSLISLFDPKNNNPLHWKVKYSLREIAPSAVIKTVQQ
jgi:hypothetical protein